MERGEYQYLLGKVSTEAVQVAKILKDKSINIY